MTKVLLVDSEPAILAVVQRVLSADDFVVLTAEDAARVRALLRRRSEGTTSVISFEGVRVDLRAGSVFVQGVEVRLTRTEWLLLQALVTNPGALLTHQQVASQVWGRGYGEEMRQTLRGHVKSLRAKLNDSATAPRYLRTESGAGYRWVAAPIRIEDRSAELGAGSGSAAAARQELADELAFLAFTLDSALGIARDMPAGPARAELVRMLELGLAAADRAQGIRAHPVEP